MFGVVNGLVDVMCIVLCEVGCRLYMFVVNVLNVCSGLLNLLSERGCMWYFILGCVMCGFECVNMFSCDGVMFIGLFWLNVYCMLMSVLFYYLEVCVLSVGMLFILIMLCSCRWFCRFFFIFGNVWCIGMLSV